ncbi:MAG: metal-dependent phosphohydrolase, partial [Lachnospiraceae bacterium]|nr:metal-dependent phosphohydrolase [Lachnospiraceae bacterium]
AARIIAVCDTYSAVTMRRSYKDERTHEEAMDIIRKASGTQLDPAITQVFMTIPKTELEACMPE